MSRDDDALYSHCVLVAMSSYSSSFKSLLKRESVTKLLFMQSLLGKMGMKKYDSGTN